VTPNNQLIAIVAPDWKRGKNGGQPRKQKKQALCHPIFQDDVTPKIFLTTEK